jgi:predicted metal-dependent phosphoesterase TrpH
MAPRRAALTAARNESGRRHDASRPAIFLAKREGADMADREAVRNYVVEQFVTRFRRDQIIPYTCARISYGSKSFWVDTDQSDVRAALEEMGCVVDRHPNENKLKRPTMIDDQQEALTAALEAYAETRIQQTADDWRNEGIRVAYYSLLSQSVEPVGTSGRDPARIQANYDRFAAALEHMRETWPFLDQKEK